MWRLLPILLLTCAPNRRFYASQKEVKAILTKSVVAINAAVECEWLFVSSPTDGDVYVQSSSKAVKEDGFNLRGYFDILNNQIDLETIDEYNLPGVTFVLLHEMGHAVGLDHETGIMVEKFKFMPFGEAVVSFVELSKKHHVIICKPLTTGKK